ncbi:response regulator [Marivirga lumbricoides]|uniref:Response regulator n=1 Tax=Marivirga lumbricoides TaxID=1046115 RepID=A0ABQ1M1R1_9BACT|nr:response regulator [Marivirga lumbricoides]
MNNQPIKILLADDDEDDRLFFEDAIEALPMRTTLKMVKNGKELMDLLLTNDVIIPDIIFLDLNMPGKNGLEYLTEIRNNSKLESISIAVYSTSSSEKDIEDSFVKGANIYINKPNDFNDLKEVLKKVLCTNWQYINTSFNKESFLLSV